MVTYETIDHNTQNNAGLSARELLFVDPGLENADLLLTDISKSVEIIHLDSTQAPLDQIADVLGGRKMVNAVHILSHGAPGALQLAGARIDSAAINANPSALDTIRSALSGGAKLVLWACSAGAGAVGKAFVDTLSAATGARVFAAETLVGAPARGGNWDIGAPAPFTPTAMAAYPHTLPTVDGTGGSLAGSTYTEVDVGTGVTVTVTFVSDTAASGPAGGGGGSIDDAFFAAGSTATSVTVTFSSPVTITSFTYFEADGIADTGSYTFAVVAGSGSAIGRTDGNFSSIAGFDGITIAPTDWFGVTTFTIASSAIGFAPGLDTIVYTVNAAPDLSISNTALAYAENAVATQIDAAGTLNDADGDIDWNTGTLVAQIAGNNEAADQISISDTDGDSTAITVVGTNIFANGVDVGDLSASGGTVSDGTALTITFDGDATNAIVEEVLQSLRYSNSSQDPSELDRTITLTATDRAGVSSVDTRTVEVSSINDDPTISGLVNDIAFTEDIAGDLDLSASAFDDLDTAGDITVTLTAGSGTMAATTDGNVVVTGTGTGTLTLVGTVAEINTFLDTASQVQYTGASNVNGNDAATVTVTANDGDGSGDVTLGTVNMDITAVDDLPTASASTIAIVENTARGLTAADFNFADVDTGDTLTTVRIDTLTVSSGTFQLSGAGVSASDVITIADINAGNLVYTPAAGTTGADLLILTFSVNDGTAFAAAPSALDIDVTSATVPVDTTPIKNTGTSDSDNIVGAGGDDTLIGGSGSDTVSGGSGDDLIWAGPDDDDADKVSGGRGDDTIGGGVGNDVIEGDEGSDVLFGGSGDDTIYATSKDNENGDFSQNSAWAGSGNDQVIGGLGADTLGGGSGGDKIEGGWGADMLFGGQDNDTVDGGKGNDSVFGGAGDDIVGGGADADLLFGGAGNDTVDGGAGNDTLWAGAGDDVLTGGSGDDTFIFGATSGNDTISDFDTSADTLDFSFSALADLAAVQAAASNANQGAQDGLLIDLGGGESVFLLGLDVADLASLSLTFG